MTVTLTVEHKHAAQVLGPPHRPTVQIKPHNEDLNPSASQMALSF